VNGALRIERSALLAPALVKAAAVLALGARASGIAEKRELAGAGLGLGPKVRLCASLEFSLSGLFCAYWSGFAAGHRVFE